jgi:hypothetical protein
VNVKILIASRDDPPFPVVKVPTKMQYGQGVLPAGQHPDTLKLLIKAFDIKLFFTQRIFQWL